MKKLILLAILLTGCSESMSPDHCKMLGVNVSDNDTITGRIIEENVINDVDTVRAKCMRPFSDIKGCAIPVYESEYVLWYIDDARIRDHERCHALYEEKRHL